MMTVEQIRTELADCKKIDRHVIGTNGKRYFVFGHTADCLLAERVENGIRHALYAMPYSEVASIEGMTTKTAKGGDGMNWTMVNERRWVTDCGCRVVATGPLGLPWFARNSHGTRITQFGFETAEQAKACVEQYVQQRMDAGLYPYNR